MLTKHKLRAMKPGQWVSTTVPDYEDWREDHRISPGDEVDICVCPRYEPRWNYPQWFEWYYSVAWRRPGRDHVYDDMKDRIRIGTWQFGLVDASSSSPNWDIETCHANHEGKGVWLYSPASDDPEICPGADWSRYECDGCGRFVAPFSNDQGDLICPTCEATGLVITQIEVLDYLETVRENARLMGLGRQLERQLNYLATYGGHNYQCLLGKDFAPYSFDFALYRPGVKDARKFVFNGGLIYQGPSCPADGSFPSLTVSLASGSGWFCHT